MTRAIAVATFVLWVLSGCATKRIPECDAFVKTIDKLASCSSVPSAQRIGILDSATDIRDALQKLDEAGGADKVPADLVSSMREACRIQDASLRQMYAACLP